jgi:DNA-directed RNA polymerase subunit RPC12/RpoP
MEQLETLMIHGTRANGTFCPGLWTICYNPPARKKAAAKSRSLYAECSECSERRLVNIAPPRPARPKGVVGRIIRRLSRR